MGVNVKPGKGNNPLFASLMKFFNNPVLLKELRIGLRKQKVFYLQLVYLLLLGLMVLIFLLPAMKSTSYSALQEASRHFFISLCVTQLILVVFISPSFTCSAITTEKEKKTLETLMVTRLTPEDILAGKLLNGVLQVFLLLTCSLPFLSIVFFLGGVSPLQVFINYAALTLWGIMVNMLGLFFSTSTAKTSSATFISYLVLVVLAFLIGAPYLEFITDSGFLMGFSDSTMTNLLWIMGYLNAVALFLLMFIKSANTLQRKASHIIILHWIFLVAYTFNVVAVTTFLLNEILWATSKIVVGICALHLLAMGFFVERRGFKSKKEDERLDSFMTSKPYFFPVYFIIISLGVFALVFLRNPGANNVIESFITIFMFALFMGFFLMSTHKTYKAFDSKYSPSGIYYILIICTTVLPVFTFVADRILYLGYKGGTSFFSGIYLSPVFSMLSAWNGERLFKQVSLGRHTIQTTLVTFLLYGCLGVLFYYLPWIVSGIKMRFAKKPDMKNM